MSFYFKNLVRPLFSLAKEREETNQNKKQNNQSKKATQECSERIVSPIHLQTQSCSLNFHIHRNDLSQEVRKSQSMFPQHS